MWALLWYECCWCTITTLVCYVESRLQCITPVFETLVKVSCIQCCLIVRSLFINTAAPECFGEALAWRSFLEALLLISTRTYREQPGVSWVDTDLRYGFQIKLLNVLQFLLVHCPSLIFLFWRITTTFGVYPQQLYLISLNRTVISCYTIQHILSSCESLMFWLFVYGEISVCWLNICTVPHFPLNTT